MTKAINPSPSGLLLRISRITGHLGTKAHLRGKRVNRGLAVGTNTGRAFSQDFACNRLGA
jgi:hypothetical protein